MYAYMYVLASLLQIMFHLDKAHYIVDEMVVNGAVVENNKANILKPLALIDKVTCDEMRLAVGLSYTDNMWL